jgi:hypothetical protein
MALPLRAGPNLKYLPAPGEQDLGDQEKVQ